MRDFMNDTRLILVFIILFGLAFTLAQAAPFNQTQPQTQPQVQMQLRMDTINDDITPPTSIPPESSHSQSHSHSHSPSLSTETGLAQHIGYSYSEDYSGYLRRWRGVLRGAWEVINVRLDEVRLVDTRPVVRHSGRRGRYFRRGRAHP